MPCAPHIRVDPPANHPTPASPMETMLSLLPLGKGEDILGLVILVSPRKRPFFNIPWESQVSEIRLNFISHFLVGEVMRFGVRRTHCDVYTNGIGLVKNLHLTLGAH